MLHANGNGLLTFEQTRELLGVTRMTVYNMLHRNELIPTKIILLGKQQRRFFSKDHVLTIKASRTFPNDPS